MRYLSPDTPLIVIPAAALGVDDHANAEGVQDHIRYAQQEPSRLAHLTVSLV